MMNANSHNPSFSALLTRATRLPLRSWSEQLLKLLVVGAASLFSITVANAQSQSGVSTQSQLLNLNAQGVILDGYDPVAFFTDNKPVKGSSDYQTKHEGATYYFASAEHQQLFEANPKKYEPQFGAF